MQNILIYEELSVAKTQTMKDEFQDFIYSLVLSPNKGMMLAYSRFGTMGGYP